MLTLQTTIKNRLDDLAGVRALVCELERTQGLPRTVVFDINVVLDEVLSNIFKYAYADSAKHDIHVTLTADNAVIEIAIDDDGNAFNPSLQPEPDLSLPLSQRPEGGLGVHFVRKLMDEVRYKRENERNYLILKKFLFSGSA